MELGLGFVLMYITGFILIIIQSNYIGMDCSRELRTRTYVPFTLRQ